ncbi:MAG: 30S ribosome-binding factor RbfA [Verrucomicrobiota bacterium]|jgi:ribosome-binding factor A|nr:30S ribosome-binding factor RbfA [Verrucomicrobiota bacterium]MDP7048307.1 30S ribosome-binding factor RbfA [Verrucomicrobiota bacterium]
MPNLRHMRVRELLKRELNEIFRREFPVELGLVSVSEVGVSNDLHSATVFVSSIGDESARRKAFRAVRKAAGKIQAQLGQAVELRYTPRLKFTLDEARNRGDRVLHILEEIEKESPLGQAHEEGTTEND